MRKLLPVLVLVQALFLLPLAASAQKNFVKGYVLTAQHDTLEGFINDKNWKRNPTEIQFKSTQDGDPRTFRPSQIKGFGLSTGDIYQSSLVSMDGSTRSILRLQAGNLTSTDTVFLRVILRGAADLLYLETAYRYHFYYQSATQPPVELALHYFLKPHLVTGKVMLMEEPRYRSQLKSYLNECGIPPEQLDRLRFKLDDLRAVFTQYNSCRKNDQYQSVVEKPKLRFAAVGGASLTHMSFDAPDRADLDNTNFKSSGHPHLGIAMNIILPRNQGRWSFYNELLWKSYTVDGNYTHHVSYSYEHYAFQTEFKITSLGLGSMVRYHLNRWPQVKPFVGFGMANNLIVKVKEHQSVRVTYDFMEKETLYEREPIGHHRKHEIGALVSAGVAYKKVTLELRGEFANGFTVVTPNNKKSVSLLFGYYLN